MLTMFTGKRGICVFLLFVICMGAASKPEPNPKLKGKPPHKRSGIYIDFTNAQGFFIVKLQS